jgi:hypothetical protein
MTVSTRRVLMSSAGLLHDFNRGISHGRLLRMSVDDSAIANCNLRARPALIQINRYAVIGDPPERQPIGRGPPAVP